MAVPLLALVVASCCSLVPAVVADNAGATLPSPERLGQTAPAKFVVDPVTTSIYLVPVDPPVAAGAGPAAEEERQQAGRAPATGGEPEGKERPTRVMHWATRGKHKTAEPPAQATASEGKLTKNEARVGEHKNRTTESKAAMTRSKAIAAENTAKMTEGKPKATESKPAAPESKPTAKVAETKAGKTETKPKAMEIKSKDHAEHEVQLADDVAEPYSAGDTWRWSTVVAAVLGLLLVLAIRRRGLASRRSLPVWRPVPIGPTSTLALMNLPTKILERRTLLHPKADADDTDLEALPVNLELNRMSSERSIFSRSSTAESLNLLPGDAQLNRSRTVTSVADSKDDVSDWGRSSQNLPMSHAASMAPNHPDMSDAALASVAMSAPVALWAHNGRRQAAQALMSKASLPNPPNTPPGKTGMIQLPMQQALGLLPKAAMSAQAGVSRCWQNTPKLTVPSSRPSKAWLGAEGAPRFPSAGPLTSRSAEPQQQGVPAQRFPSAGPLSARSAEPHSQAPRLPSVGTPRNGDHRQRVNDRLLCLRAANSSNSNLMDLFAP